MKQKGAKLQIQLVQSLVQAQRLDEAQKKCAALCRADAQNAEAWYLLGAIHGQLQEYAAAERCSRKAVALSPGNPSCHFNLGMALQKQGLFAEAAKSFREAIKRYPSYAEAHLSLGSALQGLGRAHLPDAVTSYRRALTIKPGQPLAHYNLGTALRELAQYPEAVQHFKEALRLQPKMLEAYGALGMLLRELGSLPEAVAHYEQALRQLPHEPALHVLYGFSLVDLGRLDEARERFLQALVLQPTNVDAHSGLAQLDEQQGNFAGAYERLRPLLSGETVSTNLALAFAKIVNQLGQREQAIELVERLLREQRPDNERQALHYSLAKLYDAAQCYDKAFIQWRSANALVRGSFDLTGHAEKIDRLLEAFAGDRMQGLPQAANRSPLPVFIVGMPRSGTSLVEQILASHPEVFGAGELAAVAGMANALPALVGSAKPFPAGVHNLRQNDLDDLAQSHLARLADFSPHALRVVDKMPHNFLYLGLIDLLFPGAHVIHCLRDPLDTCLSILSLPFNASHCYAADQTMLGGYYRQYQRLMAHCRQVLRVPMLEVQYETLVADQETVTRRMLEFLALPWDERCLRFYEAERNVHTFSYDQVRQPLYRKAVGRWKNYEQHLGPLIAALGGGDTVP